MMTWASINAAWLQACDNNAPVCAPSPFLLRTHISWTSAKCPTKVLLFFTDHQPPKCLCTPLKSGVAERNVSVVQDMYDKCVTAVSSIAEMTEIFKKVKTGLKQWLTLSSLLFAMVMDRLTDEIGQKSLWTMILATTLCYLVRAWKKPRKR